jgi:uncharacterized protein
MSAKLNISDDLKLPIDAATQTFAFIARKGAGKTYAAGKLTELLLEAGVQVIVLDTVGNWYGLRLAANGRDKGFDVPVLGGLRGDIPLEATGGALIADIVVDTGRSMVIDISQFSLGDRKRFVTGFGERLWQKKKGESHPSPIHLVIEESQLIVPQHAGGEEARMLGIFEEIIRLGRNYGIGVSMISQRPQSVNKEVLNQTECLFVGQVNGSQERKALKLWIVHQGMDVALIDELPSLPIGTFYVWSPQWLSLLRKLKIAPKVTLDASATPKVGDTRVRRELKPLDLKDLQQRLAETIERKKLDDPRELRKTVEDLKRQLASRPKEQVEKIVEKIVERPAIDAKTLKQTEGIVERLEREGAKQIEAGNRLVEAAKLMAAALRATAQPMARPVTMSPRATVQQPPRRIATPRADAIGEKIGKAERQILTALSQLGPCDKRRLGIRSGYAYTGGGFNNALGRCRSMGWVEGSDSISITQAGADVLGPIEPLPTGPALVEHWMGQLGRAEREILRVLIEAGGAPLGKEAIASQATSESGEPYKYDGGGFNNAVGRLRSLGLVEGRGELCASEHLL